MRCAHLAATPRSCTYPYSRHRHLWWCLLLLLLLLPCFLPATAALPRSKCSCRACAPRHCLSQAASAPCAHRWISSVVRAGCSEVCSSTRARWSAQRRAEVHFRDSPWARTWAQRCPLRRRESAHMHTARSARFAASPGRHVCRARDVLPCTARSGHHRQAEEQRQRQQLHQHPAHGAPSSDALLAQLRKSLVSPLGLPSSVKAQHQVLQTEYRKHFSSSRPSSMAAAGPAALWDAASAGPPAATATTVLQWRPRTSGAGGTWAQPATAQGALAAPGPLARPGSPATRAAAAPTGRCVRLRPPP